MPVAPPPARPRSRIALLGDAAYGNTLGGFGTGLALVGAYVLAGELALADGDSRVAFAQYDRRMHGYAKVARKGNAGPFLAPLSPMRIKMRNWTFKFGMAMKLMLKLTDGFATAIELPEYPAPQGQHHQPRCRINPCRSRHSLLRQFVHKLP